MAIAFRTGSTSTQNTTTHLTSETIALSSSIVSGDLVVVAVAWASTGAASTLALSGGGVTWTSAYAVPLGGGTGFGTGVNVRVFYAIAGSSTPSATLTGTSSNSGPVMMIACSYSGASGLDVANGSSSTASAGVATLAEPTVTTTVANDWLIAVLGAWTLSTVTLTVTNPTDAATSRSTVGTGNYQYLGLSDSNATVTTGSQGGHSWSWTGASAPAGALLAIKATATPVTSTGSVGMATPAPAGSGTVTAAGITAAGSIGMPAPSTSGSVTLPPVDATSGSAGLAALGVAGTAAITHPAVFHVASAGTYTASSTTDTITLPATLTAGDLMIVAVSANYAATSVATTHTSFTKLASAQDTANSGATCEVWYAYAAGTSGTSTDASSVCTATCGTASYPAMAFAAYSGAAVASPIDSYATGNTTSASDVTTIPCTGATTASANVLPVSCIGAGGAAATPTLTAPSGYTIRSSLTASYEAAAIADAAAVSSPGTSYGNGSWSLPGGGGGATVTFGIVSVNLAISATGSAGLPAFGMSGTVAVANPVTSTGSAGLAALASSGTVKVPFTSTGTAGLAAAGMSGTAHVAQTYYVSPSGSDSNAGTSSGAAWATITKVNAATLGPGDQVLFQGGQTWTGTQLYLSAAGTAAHPVTIGSYGTGQATISNGSGDAIYLYNAGGYLIENLTITGISGSTSYNGIECYAYDAGQLPAITISGCTITGWKYGILAGGYAANDGWNGITISGCTASGNVYAGILTYGATFSTSSPAYNHQNVTVSNCTASGNTGSAGVTSQWTGSGICLGSVNAGTITGCVAYGNGADNGDTSEGPVGIWTYASSGVTIENCVSYSNHTGASSENDGDGFDIDIDCVGCTIQYCIAYGNAGAGILAYGGSTAGYWGASSPNVVRWNLTWGNGTNGALNSNYYGELSLIGDLSGLQVYNNTFVSATTGSANPAALAIPTGTLSGVSLRNNIFASLSTADAISSATSYTTSSIECQGNLYYATSGTALLWGTSYATLAAWRTATSQEKYSSASTGVQGTPGLVAISTSPAVTNPSSLGPADGVMMAAGSAAAGTGLPLTADFSISPGTIDFFGGTLGSSLPIGAAGNIPSSGATALPAPGMSGTAGAAPPVTSAGTLGLPSLGASGTVAVPFTSTGTAALGALHPSGTVSVPFTSTGSVTLGSRAVSGTATVAPAVTTSGSAGLPALGTSGSVGVSGTIGSTGSITLPAPGVAGMVAVPFTSSGSMGLAALGVSGSETEIYNATGGITLPAPGISGTAAVPVTSTGSITLPAPGLSGSAGETIPPVTTSGSAGLAALHPSGTGAVPFTSTGSAGLAALAASGSGLVTGGAVTSSGTIGIPAAGMSGTVAVPFTSTGAIMLGTLATTGSASVPVPVTSSGSIRLGGTGMTGTASAATSANPTWDPSGAYTETFSDDFTTLNTSVWSLGWQATSGISGPINAATDPGVDGEAAAYNSTAVSVSGSNLQLALTETSITAGGVTYPYTGACVTSDPATLGSGKGYQFTGGAAEARIYLPESTSGDLIANWPAFWTDGQSWPADGEIDIVEGLGGTAQWHSWTTDSDPGVGAAAPGQGDGADVAYFSPYAGGWHTYGCSWNTTAGQIDYYYDGVHVGTIAAGVTDSPMYLILNYTTGWQSGPEQAATMLVDWVRVWSPASTAAAIPPISSLGDSFSSAATLQTLWCASSNVAVSGGRAGITCDTSYDGFLSSGTVYDLSGGFFSAKITNPSGSVETGMSLTDLTENGGASSVNTIDWYYDGSDLVASITQAGTATTVATLTYSATTHAYWKVSESGGTITWATSSNGTSWTTQGTHTHTMATGALWALIYTGNDGSGTLTTYVADVNGGSTGIGAIGSLALPAPHTSGTAGTGPLPVTTSGSLKLATPAPGGTATQTGAPVTGTGSLALPALSILQPPLPPPLPSTPGLARPGHTTPGDSGLGAPVIYTTGQMSLPAPGMAAGLPSQRLLLAFAF